MSELTTLHAWTEDDGCLVIATSREAPPSPALPHVHEVDPDVLLEADGVDPTRFLRLTLALDGGAPDDAARVRQLAGRLLAATIDQPGTDPLEVAPARLALLAQLAAVGSSRDEHGDANPWWAIEAHAIAAELGCPEVAVGDPAALLDALDATRWMDASTLEGGVGEAAARAIDVIAVAAGRAAPRLELASGGPDRAPAAEVVEIGVLPPLVPGAPVSVPLSDAEAEAEVFDLSDGARVALTDDGRHLEVEVTVAEGAYLQAARNHRVQVQRLDTDLIVGEAALESRDPEHVAAEIRLSRYTRSRPLALRLFHQRLATSPNRQLVAARVASAHARAGATLARLGRLEAAEAEFAEASTWWRTIDQDELAAAAHGAAALAAGTRPLLGEAIHPTGP